MADDKRTTPKAGETPRRKRPAPTIDLTATDVSEPATSPKEEVSAETGHTAGAEKQRAMTALRIGLLAGIGGAALMGVVLFAVWMMMPARQDGSSARTDALEKQVRELATRSNQIETGSQSTKERTDRIEQSIKNPETDPTTKERLANVENAMKAMGIALAALNHRSEEIATTLDTLNKTTANIDALQKRVEALDTAARATQEKVAQSANSDQAARLALAAVTLRDAVSHGQGYAAQLDAARSLGAAEKYLTSLAPFAASGIPSNVTLTNELTALLPSLLAASGAAPSSNFIERLQANASRLIRVRPVGEPSGDDPAAVMARIEVKAGRRDVAGAADDIARLPEKARALAQDWTKRVDARKAALAAADALAADATRAVNRP